MSAVHLYLVAYDIALPKRWRHVVKALKRHGQRVQLSIFLCRVTPGRMKRLEKRLTNIVDKEEDRLMITDLGPVDSAAARIEGENLMADLSDFAPLVV